jgi:hypothetical protein
MSKKLKTPNVMKLTFGKYSGTEISDLVNIDIDYLIWLACNSHSVRKEAHSIYIKLIGYVLIIHLLKIIRYYPKHMIMI